MLESSPPTDDRMYGREDVGWRHLSLSRSIWLQHCSGSAVNQHSSLSPHLLYISGHDVAPTYLFALLQCQLCLELEQDDVHKWPRRLGFSLAGSRPGLPESQHLCGAHARDIQSYAQRQGANTNSSSLCNRLVSPHRDAETCRACKV